MGGVEEDDDSGGGVAVFICVEYGAVGPVDVYWDLCAGIWDYADESFGFDFVSECEFFFSNQRLIAIACGGRERVCVCEIERSIVLKTDL